MRPFFLILTLCALAGLYGCAGHRSVVIPGSQTISLNSTTKNGEHELVVVLPGSYASSPNRLYPTLYFLDAHWDLAVVYSIYQQMRVDNLVPELILVGLAYPGTDEDYIRRRLHDFTPVRDSKLAGSGGGELFLQFLHQSVVPTIEERYRADPRDRALAGHSLAGLFTLNAMYRAPLFFKRYLAFSPSAITGPGYLHNLDLQYSTINRRLPARLYLSYGEGEYGPYRDAIGDFERHLSQRKYEDLQYRHEVFPLLRHTTAKTQGYMGGMIWAYKDIAPAEADTFETMMINMGY